MVTSPDSPDLKSLRWFQFRLRTLIWVQIAIVLFIGAAHQVGDDDAIVFSGIAALPAGMLLLSGLVGNAWMHLLCTVLVLLIWPLGAINLGVMEGVILYTLHLALRALGFRMSAERSKSRDGQHEAQRSSA